MKLSIITINFNNRDGLRKTIESVVNQTWQDFEYIVIDGGSSDGSVEVIKEYADRIDYWVSEPDKGIYDAMNKGIDQAMGEYCLFMNSGDSLYQSSTLGEVIAALDGTDIISGKMLFDNGYLMSPPQDITARFFISLHTLPHQATFIRRLLFNGCQYDTSYRIVSDWKFWIEQLIINTRSFKAIENIIASFDSNGISLVNYKLRVEENERVLQEIFPPRILLDYHTLIHGDTYEEKLYTIIKAHKFHKMFYALNISIFKVVSIFNRQTHWVNKFPFNL